MPQIGDVVLYRSRHGLDMAAIVTAPADQEGHYLHLHLFPPPGEAADYLDHEWGAPHESQLVGEKRGCWRERDTGA